MQGMAFLSTSLERGIVQSRENEGARRSRHTLLSCAASAFSSRYRDPQAETCRGISPWSYAARSLPVRGRGRSQSYSSVEGVHGDG